MNCFVPDAVSGLTAAKQPITKTFLPVFRRHAAEYFVDIDHGIAAGYFCLKAAEMGLGSCIIGAFHEEPLKELLHIPVEKKVKILLAAGYPAEWNLQKTVSAKNRKQLEELVCWEQYGSELKEQE